MIVAQVPSQGNQTSGTFGNRTLGKPLAPRPSTFGGGFQTGSTGASLPAGQSAGSALFAAPWRHIDPPAMQPSVGAMPAVQPARNAAASSQSRMPDYNLAELQSAADFAALLNPDMNGLEGTGLAEQPLGTAPGIGPSAASNSTAQRRGAAATSTAVPRPQTYIRSPELSDRLTQIARNKGLLRGPAIDVYLSNNVALLQGAVGKPGDCALLASLLAIEPEVQQVDNRLVAIGATQTTAENLGGGQDKNHLGGPQQSDGQQAHGNTGPHHAAGANPGQTANATTKFSGGPITINNPATNNAALSYTLDGDTYTILPGYVQDLREDRAWVIRFSRSANGDKAQYSLQSGTYAFTSTDHGWELYRSKSP
jgi:hypothetical protein